MLLNCLACGLRVNNQSTKPSTVLHFVIMFDKCLHCSDWIWCTGVCSFWHLFSVVSALGRKKKKKDVQMVWQQTPAHGKRFFFFFKALKSDVYKASHTTKGAFASISKLSSHEKAILLRGEEWELMLRWDYDYEASWLHQLNNTLMIGHPKAIFENLGTLLISLSLGKMKLFTPQRCFTHSSSEGKWR